MRKILRYLKDCPTSLANALCALTSLAGAIIGGAAAWRGGNYDAVFYCVCTGAWAGMYLSLLGSVATLERIISSQERTLSAQARAVSAYSDLAHAAVGHAIGKARDEEASA